MDNKTTRPSTQRSRDRNATPSSVPDTLKETNDDNAIFSSLSASSSKRSSPLDSSPLNSSSDDVDQHDTLVQPLERTPRPKNATTQTFKSLDFVDDRYLLQEKIGSGGMSEIYKAIDIKDNNKECAIKLISEEFSYHPHAFSALIREAKKTMSLHHPNILHVSGYGSKERYVYLVMELLEGISLAQELKKDFESFPFHARLNILIQLAQGLHYAHTQGIVHADLKPENLFLTSKRKLKILDFGIARAINEDLRLEDKDFDITKLKAFTLAYASPEIMAYEAPEISDDIYALGIIASELLFATHPYNNKDAITVINENAEANFPDTRYRMFIPIVKKAISLSRSERYRSVFEFLKDLQSF